MISWHQRHTRRKDGQTDGRTTYDGITRPCNGMALVKMSTPNSRWTQQNASLYGSRCRVHTRRRIVKADFKVILYWFAMYECSIQLYFPTQARVLNGVLALSDKPRLPRPVQCLKKFVFVDKRTKSRNLAFWVKKNEIYNFGRNLDENGQMVTEKCQILSHSFIALAHRLYLGATSHGILIIPATSLHVQLSWVESVEVERTDA